MASVTSKDIPEVFQMFGDVFSFLKKYYNPEPGDDFWEEMKNKKEKIYKKYNTKLCYDILQAIANDIGTREEKKENG